MNAPMLSVVTVCMNRQHHLLHSARRVAGWSHHHEHLILDWSSREPIERAALPDDPRLRLERIEGEKRWNLCRAYNLAVRLARGSMLLKLDADCWPEDLDPNLAASPEQSICWFGSGPDGRLGQFLMPRTAFEAVGGFNEVLHGYGFDDKDLKARLTSLSFSVQALPQAAIGVQLHSIHERVSRDHVNAATASAYEEALSFAQRRATAMSNRVAAAHYPWTAQRLASRYRKSPQGVWSVDASSIPSLEPASAAELERLRRQVFWSRFMELPELHIKLLPVKLLPPDHNGSFRIQWWHRVYWHTVRRLLRIPVNLLSACRGILERFR